MIQLLNTVNIKMCVWLYKTKKNISTEMKDRPAVDSFKSCQKMV